LVRSLLGQNRHRRLRVSSVGSEFGDHLTKFLFWIGAQGLPRVATVRRKIDPLSS
jgi:hypothetical protein